MLLTRTSVRSLVPIITFRVWMLNPRLHWRHISTPSLTHWRMIRDGSLKVQDGKYGAGAIGVYTSGPRVYRL